LLNVLFVMEMRGFAALLGRAKALSGLLTLPALVD
jgi:hypothetical protein